MFCQQCGTEHSGKYCPKCGFSLELQNNQKTQQPVINQSQQPPQRQPVKKSKNGCLTAFIIVALGILFISIIAFLLDDTTPSNETLSEGEAQQTSEEEIRSDETPETGESQQTNNEEIRVEYINSCETVNYSELMRNPQNYVGKKLAVPGKISQYLAGSFFGEEAFALYEDYDWNIDETYLDNRWYVRYSQPETDRILTDDIVTFYGEFRGLREMTSVIGAKELFPELIAAYHEIHMEDDKAETLEKEPISSRLKPLGLKESVILVVDNWLHGKLKYEVEMIEIIADDEAWEIIEDANMFIEPPDEGKEYIILKFRFKVLETEDDNSLNLSYISFTSVSGTGVEYTERAYAAGVTPRLDAEIFQDAEHAGFEVFMVDIDDENPVAVMDKDSDGELWFDLRADAR